MRAAAGRANVACEDVLMREPVGGAGPRPAVMGMQGSGFKVKGMKRAGISDDAAANE